jgi:prepilin-type processing-associated H-X9-DG protein
MDEQGQWRIRVAAGEFGPIDLDTLRVWAREGRLTPQDFVFNPGTRAGVPASGVPELAGLFPPPMQVPGRGPQPRKGLSPGCIVGLVIGAVLVVGILPAMLLPALARAREQARRSSCVNNMKQIGLALKQYSQDFREVYPWTTACRTDASAWRNLPLLFPSYNSGWESFRCPSSKDRPFEPMSASGKKKDYPFEPLRDRAKERISYAYGQDYTMPTPAPWTENAASTVRLLADKQAGPRITEDNRRNMNHRDDGRNALYQDGHVQWKSGRDSLDPDETDFEIGRQNATDYEDWWSDPPFYPN